VSIALFWDIDGTLLTTARAGVFALEEAARELGGDTSGLHDLHTSGLTDKEVAALSLEACGLPAGDAEIDEFLRRYELHLPASLHRREGTVLPGVREVLDDLSGREDVSLLLLTGNTPAGAQAKLAHYDLAGYFAGGAFCEFHEPREGIARRALPLADGADPVYVIGDTPHDVHCGVAIGARTIAVASGSYSPEELAASEPWAVLERIPSPVEFRTLIELG
jgi:phosphoglycolate phosphatase-like HAD superfamily hydrolase